MFRRPRWWAVRLLDLLVFAATLMLAPTLMVLGGLLMLQGAPPGLNWVDDLPSGRLAAGGSLVGLGVVAGVCGWSWERRQRRRYGECEVHTDGLRFPGALRAGGAWLYVLFHAIDQRTVTPHGLLVRAQGESWLESVDTPLLIPTDEAGAVRLLRLLDALQPGPDQLECQALSQVEPGLAVRLQLLSFLPFAGVLMVHAWRSGGWEPGLGFWAGLTLVLVGYQLVRRPEAPRLGALLCLRASILHGQQRLTSAEVRAALYDGEHLVLASEDQALVAHVLAPRERVEQALAWAGVRCALGSELPEWATPAARRRARQRAWLAWVALHALAAAALVCL